MARISLVLSVLISSCAVPSKVPIIYQRGTNQAMTDAIHWGVAQINEQLGCQYLEAPRADHVNPVNFFIMKHEGAPGGGQARRHSETMCSVYWDGNSNPVDYPFIVVHELLHCLGQGHVEVKGDVMNPWVQPPGWTFGPYMKELSEKYCSKGSGSAVVEQSSTLKKDGTYCGNERN